MRHSYPVVRFGPTLLVVALVLVSLAVAWGLGANVLPIAFGALPAWLWLAGRALYDNWDKFRFWVDRRRVEWTNAETALEVRGEYLGAFAAEDLQGVVASLRALPDKPTLRVNEPHEAVLQFRGFALLLRLVPAPAGLDDGVDVTLVAETTQSTHTFRTARRLVPTVTRILERVGKSLDAQGEKFTARMTFNGSNPYFGFYVQRVKPHAVSCFRCEFHEGTVGGNVSITEQGVSIVTKSLAALTTLATHYLSFGTAPYGLLNERTERRH